MRSLICSTILLFVIFTVSTAFAYSNEDCMKCHAGDGAESSLLVPLDAFRASVHGEEMGCGDCHQGVLDRNHMKTRGSGAVNCGECHDKKNRHGMKGTLQGRPACHDCHTRHGILGKESLRSSIHPRHLTKTCGKCHPSECGAGDYLSWLPSVRVATHGKQDFGRPYKESNCIGCHQGNAVHGEKTPINGDRCRECHGPSRGKSRLTGSFHARADLEKQPWTFVSAIIYQCAILLGIYRGVRFFAGRSGKKARKRGGTGAEEP